MKSASFGAVALFAVIYYASGIPRVQRDILQKIPFIRGYFIKEIPASDNVRIASPPNPHHITEKKRNTHANELILYSPSKLIVMGPETIDT